MTNWNPNTHPRIQVVAEHKRLAFLTSVVAFSHQRMETQDYLMEVFLYLTKLQFKKEKWCFKFFELDEHIKKSKSKEYV